jgi:soluble lytic murein transglycosylase-like protein
MSTDRKPPLIPLFDQKTDHSFVPAKVRAAVARIGGPEPALGQRSKGQPSGRCASIPSLTPASIMAALRSLEAIVCIVAIFASLALSSNSARAERALPAIHRASDLSNDPLAAFVAEASRRFGVPEQWIRAVMHVESGGRLQTRSRKGAMGLMQIMPKTWAELRARYSLGTDPFDPHDNIVAGTGYIRELQDRYGTPGFLAAYNAGPGRYENHLATGRPLPDETQVYVATLAPMIKGKQTGGKIAAIAKSINWTGSPLFAVRIVRNSTVDRLPHGVHPDHPLSNRAVVDLSALVPHSGNLFAHRASEVRSQ